MSRALCCKTCGHRKSAHPRWKKHPRLGWQRKCRACEEGPKRFGLPYRFCGPLEMHDDRDFQEVASPEEGRKRARWADRWVTSAVFDVCEVVKVSTFKVKVRSGKRASNLGRGPSRL